MATSIEDVVLSVHKVLQDEDLAQEILKGLSVESLLKFKCVCKSWYGIISSRNFISKHFNYQHGKNKRSKLLICDPDELDDSTDITLISESEGIPPIVEKPDHLQGFDSTGYLQLEGPVDGVFLFLKGNSNTEYALCMGLWNPATREVANLPLAHFQLQLPFLDEMGSYFGFGFDTTLTSNYKVVWVCQYRDNNCRNNSFHRAYASVYSSSTDSWRDLKHKVLTITGDVTGIPNMPGYLNGTYYWMVKKDDYCGLVSFDFRSEVFTEIRGPDVPCINCHSMVLRDGYINLLARDSNNDFALWVMIQTGVWNKLLTFQRLSPINSLFCGFWDASTVIYLTESFGLISYDVKTQKSRHLGFRHQGLIYSCTVYYYKESLVTIRPGYRELGRPS